MKRLQLGLFMMLLCAPHGQPTLGDNPPRTADVPAATQPAGAPDAGRTADYCLAVARELLEQDNYPRARVWFEAARDRAKKNKLRATAKAALDRLSLLGSIAPRLSVKDWIQGTPPSGRQLGGKVIVLFFFEIIDPAILHAVQEMNALDDRNRKNDFEMIGIASVLGELEYQQPGDIQNYLREERIKFRVGIDDGGILTLHTYKGTAVPHYAIIDRAGRVRRLGSCTPTEVDFAVRKLLAESPDTKLPGERHIMPQSRAGRELIDTRPPPIKSEVWANTPDDQPPEMRGKPRLIRFFMSACPYCRATSPAMNRIHRDYVDKGLVVIGVYHPKPEPRAVPDEEFRRAVRQLEFEFPCTVDADWSYLRKLWLDAGEKNREFTSATFLIDRGGRIRYVHPGPEFFPSDKPEKAQQNADYEAVRAAIEKVLSE